MARRKGSEKPGGRPGRPAAARSAKKKRTPAQSGRVRSVPAPPAPDGPACVRIAGEGSCPEWEGILAAYPMIDAVQREDFPEEGASFVHLAHFYRSEDPAKEGVVVLKEFKKFFRAVGYRYDTAGDYDSRWFEGVGTRIRR